MFDGLLMAQKKLKDSFHSKTPSVFWSSGNPLILIIGTFYTDYCSVFTCLQKNMICTWNGDKIMFSVVFVHAVMQYKSW